MAVTTLVLRGSAYIRAKFELFLSYQATDLEFNIIYIIRIRHILRRFWKWARMSGFLNLRNNWTQLFRTYCKAYYFLVELDASGK